MEKKYKALRIVGVLYKILAVIVAVLTLLLAIFVFISSLVGGLGVSFFERGLGSAVGAVLAAILLDFLILLYGAFISLGLYAFGDLIFLLISIEENTRAIRITTEKGQVS